MGKQRYGQGDLKDGIAPQAAHGVGPSLHRHHETGSDFPIGIGVTDAQHARIS